MAADTLRNIPDPPDPAQAITLVTADEGDLFRVRTDFAKILNDAYAVTAWLRSNAHLIQLPPDHAPAFRSRMDRAGMLIAEAAAQVAHAAFENTQS